MTTTSFHAKSIALEVIQGLNVNLDGKIILITGSGGGAYEAREARALLKFAQLRLSLT